MIEQKEKIKYRETLLVIVLGFAILYLVLRHEWMLYTSVGLGVLGMLSSHINRWIHLGWLFIGEKLGWVVNKIIMGTLYLVVLIPISMLARIFRKDIMQLKPGGESTLHQRKHQYTADDLKNPW